MRQKILKWTLFPLFFVIVFLGAIYWNFPAKAFRDPIKSQMENFFGGRVEIGEVALWRLSGLDLGKVVIQEMGADGKFATTWQFESLKVRLGLLSFLFGNRRVEFQADLYGGFASGAVSVGSTQKVSAVELDVASVDLKKVSGIEKKLGSSLGGLISLSLDLDFGKNPVQDGEMQLNLAVEKFAVALLPGVELGTLNADIKLEKGKASNQPLKISGADVESNATLSLELSNDIWRSRVDGSGWVKFMESLMKKQPGFDRVLEGLQPQMRSAKDAEGKYAFWIQGTADRPRYGWGQVPGPAQRGMNNPLRTLPQ